MALLGQGWEDPKSAAIMALAGGLLQGNMGGGLLGASQAFTQSKDNAFRNKLLDAQYQETLAQAEERKQKLEMARRAEERQNQLLFGSPAGGMPGAAPAGGGMPGMPGAAPGGAPSQGGAVGLIQFARDLGIPEQAIQADIAFNGGKKIAELLAERSKPNWQNVNGNLVNTAAPGFQGGFQPGMSASNDGKVTAWQPDGKGGLVVGAPRGALDTYAAYQGVGERTKAAYDPMKVYNPATQREEFVPRSQVAGPESALRGQVQGGMGADPAVIQREIAQTRASLPFVKDAASRAQLEAYIADLQRQAAALPSGPMAAGPSTAESAAAAAAKTKAEADARAESERQTGRTKKSDSANEMLRSISRAKNLLDLDPTGSLGGAAIDKVVGAVGMTTPGGNVANSLETLSGWLVSNVPRMEGPQSNYDVENYRVMAGRIGDRTVPIAARKAALAEVERIQQKYAGLNEGAEPEQPLATPPKPMKGMVRNGYRFKGGDPADKNNWEKQ
jgi:hypothetical protein